MIRNVLLAMGIVLTTASQLRLPAVPLGFGELCLVLWLGLSLLRLLASDRISNPEAVLRIGAFWACFAFALSVGTCIALFRQELDPTTMLHDASAYVLMVAFTCLIVATLPADGSLRQTQWFLIAFWNIALMIQLAMGWGIISLPSVNPWYWDRFRGWAENPNQVALYCAVFAPLSLSLALSSNGLARIAASFSCLLSFAVGRLTKSDTFLIAMVAAIAFFLVLRLRTWLAAPEHRFSMRFVAALFVAVVAVPLALALTPYAIATADDVESLAISLAKDQGGEATVRSASLRVQLWNDAMARGLEAASLGLGPGPHLERPNVTNRQALPMPFEAHSTLLDVFTQAGLLGLIAFSGLLVSTIILVLRKHLDALAAMIAAIAIFSVTHFILRHPIVWFALALSLVLGSARTPSPHARTGR
jgi:O-antigen ligase